MIWEILKAVFIIIGVVTLIVGIMMIIDGHKSHIMKTGLMCGLAEFILSGLAFWGASAI